MRRQNNFITIKPNTSGKVREVLCLEDVYIEDYSIVEGFGLVKTEIIDDEKVLWFKDPIRIPKFNMFYASRIRSVDDPYLVELIRRLLYINPKPDALMVKKLTEFIVMRFSKMVPKESQVKVGEIVFLPVLTFEEVETVVRACKNSKALMDGGYVPDNEVPVLFQRNSKLTRGQKITIMSEYRGYMVTEKMESIIHTATEHLIDTKEYLKITKSRIRETGIVETNKGVASVNTISKYIAPRTKKVIEDHNHTAPFKTQNTEDLYREFLKLPEHQTITWYSQALECSNSTIIEFKKLKDSGIVQVK